jgi:hypothetical protein
MKKERRKKNEVETIPKERQSNLANHIRPTDDSSSRRSRSCNIRLGNGIHRIHDWQDRQSNTDTKR